MTHRHLPEPHQGEPITTTALHDSRRQFLRAAAGVTFLGISGLAGNQLAAASPIARPQISKRGSDPTGEVVDYFKQWMFDANNPRHTLLPKPSFAASSSRNYNLKNFQMQRFLQWEKQKVGINLGWTDNASPQTAKAKSRWFFTRLAKDQKPLRYGEWLALGYGVSPSYIRYSSRPIGINLDWSSRPIFEWKLLGGPIGSPVSSGSWLAIYNHFAGDCLIYFNRNAGGDIGWPSSETWTDQLGDILTQAVKDHWKEAVAALLAL